MRFRLTFFNFFFILFQFLFSVVNAQDIVKNLESQYNKTVPNSNERFEVAGKYAQVLFFNEQQDKAHKILNQNIQLAEKKSDGKYAAYLYSILAITYRIEDQLIDSKKSLEKAISASKRSSNLEIKGYVNYCEGWLNYRNQEESKAVKNFIQAIKFYEAAPKSSTILQRLSAVYKELTSIYANWNEYELHEKYSKLLLEVALKQNDPNTIFDAYMAMGHLYEQQFFQNEKNIYLRDLSEKYYTLAINFYNKNKNVIIVSSNLSYVANNLANLYLKYYPKNYLKKAIYYAELAKNVAIQINQPDHIAAAYGILSEISLAKNDTETAKLYLLSSLKEINESNLNEQRLSLSIYESLSTIYEQENNHAEALRFYKLYMQTYQSIFDQEKLQISKRLEAQFEKELQQQQMIRLQLEAEKKEQQINLMQALGIQQKQELVNSKLREDFQQKKLTLSQLESDKRAQRLTISQQQLKLSTLENKNRKDELLSYIDKLNFKNKLNKFYIIAILFSIGLLALLLYALKQRNNRLKQREELYQLEIDKERQNSKISTLTALLEGQEQERERLARDLHDGLGGLLSGTKIQLTQLNDTINNETKSKLTQSIQQLDGAVDELRRVAHNLMPDLLLNYGLEEALKEYAIRMSNSTLDLDVQFLSYTKTLHQDTQLLVYRIIQELVNNSIKHAQPSQIIIQFVEDETAYSVTVEDDGIGFEIEEAKKRQSAGLYNIQSRIQFLKGTLNIHSEKNMGTSIEFQFPKI